MQAVAKLGDVPQDRGLEVKVGDEKVLLVRDGEAVRAFQGECPHAGASLAKGAVCDGRIVCPWHKAMFRVSDGGLMEPPALERLARYEVRVEGEDVLVGAKITTEQRTAEPNGRVAVIVGGGAAGAAAAAGLREFGWGGQVVVIGREGGPPYDRTALSKAVMAGGKPVDEVLPLLTPEFLEAHRIELRRAEVTGLDAAAKHVTLGGGEAVAFDVALVATGSAPKRPELEGIGLRGVHTLRDRGDASAILAGVQTGGKAVVMGSSFIGLEVASGLRKQGMEVAVVTPESVPFEKQMGARLGAMFKALHEKNGVTFHTGTQATALAGGDDGAVTRVALKDGSSLPASLVIVGVGVAPETAFVSGVERAEDGGIAVDAGMRGATDVFVAGDAARFPYQGERAKIEHWRVAQQMARVAARGMVGEEARFEGVPYLWTAHYGKRFDYLGHPASWDDEEIDGDVDEQKFVALLLKSGEVVGVVACQRDRVAGAMLVRMRSGLSLTEARALIRSAEAG